ncbi:MAG: bifunctional folylpolyglutamate synthase/dihydrofolate synthase [Syntrophobacterales bacterium]|nr:MAG: bifunctional folylpolyglutamate synthase/dihydrofolate synthase [Syntrophobacterales bacterium]
MESREYKDSMDYLFGLERHGIVFGLANILKILKSLGNPHEKVKVIHVGGTNGKGSTAAMIQSILCRYGYRIGLYTSPHLISFTERLRIDGREITEEEVVRLTHRIRGGVRENRIPETFTFFDFTTAMAMLYFVEAGVDLAIVEVGLGGRLDSTNVVDPLLAIITNISMDHRDYLGGTLEEVAREKAGIIKEGRAVVTAASQPRVLDLLRRISLEKKAPLFRVGRDFRARRVGPRRFNYHGRKLDLPNLELNLAGRHQITNAITALGAIEMVRENGYMIGEEAIYEGLRGVRWSGRLEVVMESPMVLLDGAHNPGAAKSLKEAIVEEFVYERLLLVLGIMNDKDYRRIISILVPLADMTVLCRPRCERAALPQALFNEVNRIEKKGKIIEDVGEAVQHLLSIASEKDLICITGSFYTIGEAKAFLSRPKRQSPDVNN